MTSIHSEEPAIRPDLTHLEHAQAPEDTSRSAPILGPEEVTPTIGIAVTLLTRARDESDEVLKAARAQTDAQIKHVGLEAIRMKAEQEKAERVHAAERTKRRRAFEEMLRLEREETDRHLLIERACADEALERIHRELVEAIKLRDEFLSLASHELKTPLTPLALRLQTLEREAARHPNSPFALKVARYSATANSQVRKLSALVAGLLDVNRITSGKMTLELEPVDLGAVIHDVEAHYRPRAEKAGCLLHVDAPSVKGNWNELRLEQAVTNLLENAIKYGAGKPIHVRLQKVEDQARLTVQDEGIGISEEHLPRIFGRFERAASTRHYGGLGLGLYICRTIVEAMDGTIGVNSELGKGSTFFVELPLAGPKDEEPAISATAPLMAG